MQKMKRYVFLLLLGLILTGWSVQKVIAAPNRQIAKGARIFVDKVNPAHSNLSEADFRQLSDAGFTVVAKKWDSDLQGKPIDFGKYAERSAKSDLSVVQWKHAQSVTTDHDDQTLTRTGKTTKYTRPQSQRGWQELTDYLVGIAKLSIDHPNIKGVLLDYEIYDKNKTDGFCESYDDQSFREFLISVGKDAPDPLPVPEDRRKYLSKLQILQMYIGVQIDQIAKRAHTLRQAIDAVNPEFQIGIYGWGALVPPVIHELATPQASALILDAMTYGRSKYSNAFTGGYDAERPDKEALKWSLDTVKKGIAAAHQRYDNVIFLAAHYPQSPGPKDQYKFTAKQAFQSAAFGEGYWIWTDWKAPKPWTNKREWYDAMMAYFGKANAALDAKDWKWAANQPVTVE